MSSADKRLRTRAVPVAPAGSAPASYDPETRSLEFTVSTEAPIPMWDWERGDVVPEVLLSKGALLPAQVPLLDTHDRGSTQTVLGSVRDLRVQDGRVVGRAVFSSIPRAHEALTQYAEGHLTDFSAGYVVNARTYVPKGEKARVAGSTWDGPVSVVTSWSLKEASACPIGADPGSKARSSDEPQPKTRREPDMRDIERELEILQREKAEREEAERKQKELEEAEAAVIQMRKERGALAERARRLERERQQQIQEAAAEWAAQDVDLGDLVERCIQDGTDIAEVRRLFTKEGLRLLPKAADPLTSRGTIVVGKEEREKFRECAAASLLVRAGRRDLLTDPKLAEGHDLASLSLKELFQRSMRVANVSGGFWSERSITTSDIPYFTGDFINKLSVDGYMSTSVTWRQWCKTATVSNAHTIHIPLPSQVSKAKKINMNDGEYQYLTVSDAQETTELYKPGGMIQISEKAILNDDLLQISNWATGLGESIVHAVNAMVYGDGSSEYPGVLFGSGGIGETMRDSTALFTSGHANYVAHGSGAAPSVTTLGAARSAMRKQLDIGSTRPLNWIPKYLIVPAALEATSLQILNSERLIDGSSTAAQGERNPFYQNLELVVEPLLDTISSDAAAQWYVASNMGRAVWVIFHESTNDRPTLEQRPEWTNDSITWKGHIKVAVKACDWRGLYCNHGN